MTIRLQANTIVTVDASLQIKLLLGVKDLSKMKLSAESASELKALLRPHRIPSYTQEGPLLFTHQGKRVVYKWKRSIHMLQKNPNKSNVHIVSNVIAGISGPVVLRLSAFAAKVVHCLGYRFNVSINFLPDASEENVIEMLSQEKRKHPMR